MKTAVITGPTGAIGIALCELLADEGIKVYAVCRKESRRISNIPKAANIVFCDISELNRLDELIDEKIDAFFHLAWLSPSGEGRYDTDLQMKNIQYSLDALRCAKRLNANVFIGAGSQAQYGRKDEELTPDTKCEPENAYGVAKQCAESFCRIESKKIGIDFFWPRILSVYGPYDGEGSMIIKTIRCLLNNRVPDLTEGSQTWDFLYCKDAANALYLIAEKGKSDSIYVLASGISKPLKEYVIELRNAINPSLELGFGNIKQNNILELRANISSLSKDTGFYPETKFSEGIIETINYCKGNNQ